MRQLLASRLRAFRRIAAAMMIALYPAWTFAADWPQRPVTVVVPFAAGGNTDTVARILCQRLTEKLGQPFVIDNRGGASGAIAAANVASAAPDGYTLLLGSTPQIAIVPFIQKVSYDPRKDLIPTNIFAIGTFVLAVSAAVPADTMADFIAYAKARPGKLVYGSGGNATISRLGGALFAARAGLQLVHVPYRGGGPAVMDFLANRFDMYFGSALEFVQYRDDKRIRLLGISSEQASPQFPGLPPIADVLPGFKLSTWNGLMLRPQRRARSWTCWSGKRSMRPRTPSSLAGCASSTSSRAEARRRNSPPSSATSSRHSTPPSKPPSSTTRSPDRSPRGTVID
jgi:tripartite-type tricarboxylate transporter receptor subunit TctC